MEGTLHSRAHPVCSVTSPYEMPRCWIGKAHRAQEGSWRVEHLKSPCKLYTRSTHVSASPHSQSPSSKLTKAKGLMRTMIYSQSEAQMQQPGAYDWHLQWEGPNLPSTAWPPHSRQRVSDLNRVRGNFASPLFATSEGEKYPSLLRLQKFSVWLWCGSRRGRGKQEKAVWFCLYDM